MNTGNSKVFVGLSGGVDSSVSAALLVEQGYAVTGVFIKTWQPDWIECTWREDRRDAMRIAAQLGIPFMELDLEAEYKQHVVDYLISEYKKGRTPNPDSMCNQHIKFGAFYEWARSHGADYVATGHYVRVGKADAHTTPRLLAGLDINKDQSYFLWGINRSVLPHILFPVGELEKSQVREKAAALGLATAVKKDSQGICMLGDISIKDFLSHYVSVEPGDVLDEQGQVIGQHPGALFFTEGERRGFTITKKGTDDAPLYVLAKDLVANTITVGEIIAQDQNAVVLENFNTLSDTIVEGREYFCRLRYRGPLVPCVIKRLINSSQTAHIELLEKSHLVTKGQSLVLYDGDVCLGGGVIS